MKNSSFVIPLKKQGDQLFPIKEISSGKLILKNKKDYLDLFDALGSFLIETRSLRPIISITRKLGATHEILVKEDKISVETEPYKNKLRYSIINFTHLTEPSYTNLNNLE